MFSAQEARLITKPSEEEIKIEETIKDAAGKGYYAVYYIGNLPDNTQELLTAKGYSVKPDIYKGNDCIKISWE